MGKFHGNIGFSSQVETSPGVYEDTITERPYYGDLLRTSIRWEKGQDLNDNVRLANQVSIVADDYALNNTHMMRYVVIRGHPWTISAIDVNRPRLVLSLGGLYHGPKPN